MRRLAVCALVFASCTASQATIARNIGVGLTGAGIGVGGSAVVTRDPDDDLGDAIVWSLPLLVPGVVLWVGGQLAGD